MAVNKNNIRRSVTFTKKQADYLDKAAERLGISFSKYIRIMLNTNFTKLASFITPEQLEEYIAIAKTQWLFDDEED